MLFSFVFGAEIFADRMERLPNGEVLAEGSVEGYYRNYHIRADYIRYNPETKELYAEGNVYIRSLDGKLEVKGSFAWLNLDSDVGYFLNADGRFERFYFKAGRVDKEEQTYRVKEGEITTCPPERRELRLCLSRAVITKEYVFSYNNSLRLFNVPLAYLPLAVYPVGERRSGLLPPLIGSNTYNSFIYQQPIYWAVSKDKDMTLSLDYRTSQAKGVSLEYRQAIRKPNDLKLNLSFYDEPTPMGRWWEGRDPKSFRENRYRISLELDAGNLKAGVDTTSDPYFMQDVYFRTQERTKPYLVSYLSYIKDWERFTFTLDLSKFYDTTSPDNGQTLNRLPEANLYLKDTRLLGELYASAQLNLANFYRQDGLRAKRTLFFPQLYYPLRLGSLTLLSSLTLENALYFDLNQPYEKSVSTFKFSERIPFFLDKSLGSWSLKNFLEIAYEYRPKGFENPRFDPLDQLDRISSLKLSYRNFTDYRGRQVMSLFVEGGIDYANKAKYQGQTLAGRLLPLRSFLSITPFEGMSLTTDNLYDPNASRSLSSSSYLNLSYAESVLSLGYIQNRNVDGSKNTDQYTYGLSTRYKDVGISFSVVHDNRTSKDLYRRLAVDYRGACWSLGLLLRDTYNGQAGRYIKEFFLVVNIFDLQSLTVPLKR